MENTNIFDTKEFKDFVCIMPNPIRKLASKKIVVAIWWVARLIALITPAVIFKDIMAIWRPVTAPVICPTKAIFFDATAPERAFWASANCVVVLTIPHITPANAKFAPEVSDHTVIDITANTKPQFVSFLLSSFSDILSTPSNPKGINRELIVRSMLNILRLTWFPIVASTTSLDTDGSNESENGLAALTGIKELKRVISIAPVINDSAVIWFAENFIDNSFYKFAKLPHKKYFINEKYLLSI